jgi:hypothetical protein
MLAGMSEESRHDPCSHAEQEEAAEAVEQATAAVEQARRAVREQWGALGGVGLGAMVGGLVLGRFRRAVRRVIPRGRLRRRFGFGVLVVVLSVATCSYGVDTTTLTADWGEPVRASTEDAGRVLTRSVDLLRAARETGNVRIAMTEAEATAALSIGLLMPELSQAAGRIPQEEVRQATDLEALRERVWEEAELQRQELAERSGWAQRVLLKLDPRIRTGHIEVRFEETGEVVMAGYIEAWRFRLPGLFVVAPSAGGGELELDFVSGRLGRLPLPEVVFDWIGRSAARAVLVGKGVARLEEITVGDGTLKLAVEMGG